MEKEERVDERAREKQEKRERETRKRNWEREKMREKNRVKNNTKTFSEPRGGGGVTSSILSLSLFLSPFYLVRSRDMVRKRKIQKQRERYCFGVSYF
jgi:hypothetical protein